jgi:hypothetical protein
VSSPAPGGAGTSTRVLETSTESTSRSQVTSPKGQSTRKKWRNKERLSSRQPWYESCLVESGLFSFFFSAHLQSIKKQGSIEVSVFIHVAKIILELWLLQRLIIPVRTFHDNLKPTIAPVNKPWTMVTTMVDYPCPHIWWQSETQSLNGSVLEGSKCMQVAVLLSDPICNPTNHTCRVAQVYEYMISKQTEFRGFEIVTET